MNYIQQAYKGLHEWWRYLVGFIIIGIAWQFLGAIPLIVALFSAMGFEEIAKGNMPSDISFMAELLGNNLFLFLMLVSFAVGLLALFFTSTVLHKLSIKDLTTTRHKIDWSRFWFIFILWGVISSGLTVADYFMDPESYVVNVDWSKFAILALIVLLFIPLQTSFEEYFFRGYLMHAFGVIFKNKWAPLLITSVGFGLLHIFNPEVATLGPMIMVFYIGTGLLLGIITLMDDGLELALGFHAANNLFTALLVSADWTALQTDSILRDISDPTKITFGEIVVPILIMFPLILLILAKKYKWTNWKEKLFGNVVPPPKEDYKVID